MAQVSYPGVYVQERSSGVRTITGVSTSIAAFFGRTTKGPINRAVRCLSRSDFIRTFGAAHPQSELGASLNQFYANGGTDCYVVRLTHGATAASVDLSGRANDGVVLHAAAKSEGAWGNGIRLEVDYGGPNPGETFGLRVSYEEGGREVASERFDNLTMDPASPSFAPALVTQNSALIDLTLPKSAGPAPLAGAFSQARRPLGADPAAALATLEALVTAGRTSFDISIDGSAWVTVDLSTPAFPTDVQGLTDQINAALSTLVPTPTATATMEKGPANQMALHIASAANSVHVRRSAANDLAAALLLGAENGGVELGRWSSVRPAPTGTTLAAYTTTGDLTNLNKLAGLPQDHLKNVTIGSDIPVGFDLTTTKATDSVFQDHKPGVSPSANNDGVREKLQIVAQAISTAAGSKYRAEVRGYDLVILAKDGTLNAQPAKVVFSAPWPGTAEINTHQYALGKAGVSAFSSAGTDGNDGSAPQFADYVGDPVSKTGFNALDPVDLFNLMLLPPDQGVSAATAGQLWGPASIYCASRRAFLLIDPPDAWTASNKLPRIVQNTSEVSDLRGTVVKDHSAVYYPKLRINDGGLIRTIGPCGSIAGLMARVDASRGVWKAPAGTEADLRGIIGLDSALTDLENGVLNKLGVNCLRSFVSGSVSWGARTLDGADELASEWKYVPIRRLALLIEESLYRGTQWVVFEPNDEPLWANIRLNVGVFMHQLFRQGAFQGSTPDQAYFVKCDAETTTQADRNLGVVNIEVGFAPLKPAEFVVLTIQQIAGDLL